MVLYNKRKLFNTFNHKMLLKQSIIWKSTQGSCNSRLLYLLRTNIGYGRSNSIAFVHISAPSENRDFAPPPLEIEIVLIQLNSLCCIHYIIRIHCIAFITLYMLHCIHYYTITIITIQSLLCLNYIVFIKLYLLYCIHTIQSVICIALITHNFAFHCISYNYYIPR